MFNASHVSKRQENRGRALKQTFKKMSLSISVRFVLLFFSISLCLNASVFASEPFSGKAMPKAIADLNSGKDLLEEGNYKDALKSLALAYDGLPVVRDYILFFMAKAYTGLDKFDESEDCIRKILRSYPDSPLKKRARSLELRGVLGSKGFLSRRHSEAHGQDTSVFLKDNAALQLLESYVSDYPEDSEMSFLLARVLKEKGETDQARKMFVKLYVGNSSFSETAHKELKPSDISLNNRLDKAANLLKSFEYQKAETILRKMLPSSDDEARDEAMKRLGSALFGQKRYAEAGDAFLKAGDFYNSARSFLRAGDLNAFNDATAKLVSMEDKRAGGLLIAYASKKRRDGSEEEALKVYLDVKRKYPSHAEDALWGIAWAHYRDKDYKSALTSLTELDDKYPNPRYRYWKWKCSPAGSPRPPVDFQARAKNGRKDIYSVLLQLDDPRSLSGRPVRQAAWTAEPKEPLFSKSSFPSRVRAALERFDILLSLNMKDDAVIELVRAANKVSSPDVLFHLCRVLQEAGAYNKSLSLLSRFSGRSEADINDLLYPLAYWPVVKEISRRYMLDPLILLSVMREESRFNPSARSFAGALGLMQIMPQTAFNLDRRLDLNISGSSAVYNVRTNITVGAYYLNSLLKEFKSLPAALAAYNAGQDKVREWLKAGNYGAYDEFIEDIPYAETRNYVKSVLVTYFSYLNLMDTRYSE